MENCKQAVLRRFRNILHYKGNMANNVRPRPFMDIARHSIFFVEVITDIEKGLAPAGRQDSIPLVFMLFGVSGANPRDLPVARERSF